jgi:hypothetical protein
VATAKLIQRIAMLGGAIAVATPCVASPETALRIIEAPAYATANVGGAASFRVVIEAASPVSYRWFHDDRPVDTASGATLVIPHVTNADAGRYRVVASTATGSLPAGPAMLTVKPPPTLPIVDPTFHGDPALSGTPTVMLPLPDGRVLLATTTVVSSWDFNAHADLFRLRPDGRIDPAFRVGRFSSAEFPQNIDGAVYPPETPTVRQLLVQPDGRVIVVGNFAFFNGAPRGGIARINPDGTIDERFAPEVTAHNLASVFPYSSETVAALQPDGKLVLLASVANSSTQLVRLGTDGRQDPTFVAADSARGGTALAVDRGGRILVGSGGPRGPGNSGRVLALRSDGQVDATFTPFACDPVQRLYALDDGRVVVTTQYDRGPVFPGGSNVSPRLPTSTFRLRANGEFDPDFPARPTLLTTPPAPDGTLFLARTLIAPDGRTETTPDLAGPEENSSPLSYTLGRDGQFWVTGSFSLYHGVSSARIARVNIVSREDLTPPRVLALWADRPVVKYGESVMLHAAPVGEGPLTYTWLWPFNDGVFAVTNQPSLEVWGSTAAEQISYRVRVTNSAGAATSQEVTLTHEPAELRIEWQPQRVSLTPGRRAEVSLQLAAGSRTSSFAWSRDGQLLQPDDRGRAGPIERVEAARLFFGDAQPAHAGTYRVTLRDPRGRTVVSEPIVVTIGDRSRFTNLSTRAQIGQGEQAAILGFVIPPGRSRTVLLRGIGPGLASLGVDAPLPDPRLDLFNSSGTVLGRNNRWQVTFTGNGDFDRVGAFALADGSQDTALNADLQPGSYTVRLSSLSNMSGVGLIELYENDTASDRLFNLSSRVFVAGAASSPAIAGFAIRGAVGKHVLVRAAGPALSAFGVAGPLADPRLEIRDEQGNRLSSNNDWQDAANADELATAARSLGAFPFGTGSKDAALLLTLPPGNYSGVVTSNDGTSGTALIEIYELP